MTNTQLNDTLLFPCGKSMKNRFMLAPMTNSQSHEDGRLSKEELHWLSMRAKGQFGLVMTCASHVQKSGKGFPGQLGIFGDELQEGHNQLCKEIQKHGSLAVIQIFHAGMRSPQKLIGQAPVCPSDHEETGSRALTLEEVKTLRDDFIQAAVRAKAFGYDGVEIHGAHGYIICQFLSAEINLRSDEYGGSLENRSRLLMEIVDGVRAACGPSFLVGVRLSPERFGMKLAEIKTVCQQLVDGGKIDFLDVSLWDCFKNPEETAHQHLTLLQHFTELDYKNVLLTVAGKIRNGQEVQSILASQVDFVTIGKSAILHHDFPQRVLEDASFQSQIPPVSRAYLNKEGLSEKFIDYMSRWPNFVAEES